MIKFDFVTNPTNCGVKRAYSVSVDGTGTTPPWLTLAYDGNNGQPSLTVSTSDTTKAGIYTVVVQASVTTSSVIYSDQPLKFTITMDTN